MEVSLVTCTLEVSLDLLGSFTLAQSDLQASITSAGTFHVVLLDLCRNNVLDVSASFKGKLITIGWKSTDIDINDFSLLCISTGSIVSLPSILIIDKMRSKELLLVLLGRFGSGWYGRCLLLFVVINSGVEGAASEPVTVGVCSQLSLLHVGSHSVVPSKIFGALLPGVCGIQPIVGRRKKSLVWFFIW